MIKNPGVGLLCCIASASAFSSLHVPLGFLGSSGSLSNSCFAQRSIVNSARKHEQSLVNLHATLGKSSTAKDVIEHFGADLRGKTALVTGGNSGIGLETVKALAFAGCRVLLCSRDVQAGKAAVVHSVQRAGDSGYAVTDPDVSVLPLDLADLESVEALADAVRREPRLDFLVLNAGIMATPQTYTKQGFESQIGVNHFGHFHLTTLLLDYLKAQSHPSRIVSLASTAHTMGDVDVNDLHYKGGRKYGNWQAYGQSKLANILFVQGLRRKLSDTDNIVSVSVHPGVISTPLWRSFSEGGLVRRFLLPFIKDKSVAQGAATTVYACLAPDLNRPEAVYLTDCAPARPNERARDLALADRLWAATEEQIAAVRPGPAPSDAAAAAAAAGSRD